MLYPIVIWLDLIFILFIYIFALIYTLHRPLCRAQNLPFKFPGLIVVYGNMNIVQSLLWVLCEYYVLSMFSDQFWSECLLISSCSEFVNSLFFFKYSLSVYHEIYNRVEYYVKQMPKLTIDYIWVYIYSWLHWNLYDYLWMSMCVYVCVYVWMFT